MHNSDCHKDNSNRSDNICKPVHSGDYTSRLYAEKEGRRKKTINMEDTCYRRERIMTVARKNNASDKKDGKRADSEKSD